MYEPGTFIYARQIYRGLKARNQGTLPLIRSDTLRMRRLDDQISHILGIKSGVFDNFTDVLCEFLHKIFPYS